MLDLLIRNGKVIDGTGKGAYFGSVGVKNGKIVLAEPGVNDDAANIIDATGKYITPGFIDAHSHGDLVLGKHFAQLCKTSQGVTTEMVGQCGLSMAPVNPQDYKMAQGLLSIGAVDFPKEMESWTHYPSYLEYIKTLPLTTNVKMFVGHSTLRKRLHALQRLVRPHAQRPAHCAGALFFGRAHGNWLCGK